MTIGDCLASNRDLAGVSPEEKSIEGVRRFIEMLVAGALGASLAELRGEKRGRAPAAFARQTAMYLAHVHCGLKSFSGRPTVRT